MMISRFEVTPYIIPFVKPLKTAGENYTHRQGVWLKLKWGNLFGNGEAAPLHGFSCESLKEVHYALEGFHQAMDGENYDNEDIQSLINIHTERVPSAKFALETAVFDLLAQRSNKSIAEYLNPNYKSQIAVNGITGLHLPGEGFKFMKVKLGFRNLFDEIENMESLTQSYGENVQFRLDLNAALDLPRAIRFCKEMEQFNVDYVEQPIAARKIANVQ